MNVDSAHRALCLTLSKWKDVTLSESDTRAKLIDPVFRNALGWSEDHIRREEPVAEGFVDYTLMESDRRFALIEAKRTKSRFDIPARPTKELYVVGGAALSSKTVRAAIRQAAGYAPNLGCPFVIITDGLRYIVVQALQALELSKRTAIVFTDLTKQEQFRDFYELLSYSAVRQASLHRAFMALDGVQRQHAPLDWVDKPDNDLGRNKLWSILNYLATRVLEDRPESRAEIITHCYVSTQESNETDQALKNLIAKPPRPLVRESGSVPVKPTPHGRTSLGHTLEAAIKDRRAGVYILTGGVGSGKTTFLNRFETLIEPALVSEYCAWFHIDFLPMARPEAGRSDMVESHINHLVRQQVLIKYDQEVPTNGTSLRSLFAQELRELESTILYQVEEDSPERRTIVNEKITSVFGNNSTFVTAAIRRLISLGRRPVFVLDNSDQLGEDFQENVVLIARKLKEAYSAICIVSLRDDKFYAAYYRGVFNAFMTFKFYIGSPDLQEVLRLRLNYGLELMHKYPDEFVDVQTQQAARFRWQTARLCCTYSSCPSLIRIETSFGWLNPLLAATFDLALKYFETLWGQAIPTSSRYWKRVMGTSCPFMSSPSQLC